MIAAFSRPETQRDLFFALLNSFSIFQPIAKKHKTPLAGCYAIFKNNQCVYVGESKNIASRLTTHVLGVYSKADHIRAWFADKNAFYDSNEATQKSILLDNEAILMQELKPINNMVSFERVIDSSLIFERIETLSPDLYIQLYQHDIAIYSREYITIPRNCFNFFHVD